MAIKFLKGGGQKPTGNAQPPQVLEGTTFSNEEGINKVGLMRNRGKVVVTPSKNIQNIGEGYFSEITVDGDMQLVPENILEPIEIFGVKGKLKLNDASTGNAQPPQVLEGYSFSNSDGVGKVGTMVNHGDKEFLPSIADQVLTAGFINGLIVRGVIESKGLASVGDVLKGVSFSNKDSNNLVGTLELTGDSIASNVLAGKTFYNTNPKSKLTGTMVNHGDKTFTPSSVNQNLGAGFINSLVVQGDTDFVEGNIKKGVNLWGKVGTLIPFDLSSVKDIKIYNNVRLLKGVEHTVFSNLSNYDSIVFVGKLRIGGIFVNDLGAGFQRVEGGYPNLDIVFYRLKFINSSTNPSECYAQIATNNPYTGVEVKLAPNYGTSLSKVVVANYLLADNDPNHAIVDGVFLLF